MSEYSVSCLGFRTLFRRNGRQGIDRQGGLLGGLFSSGLWIVPVSAVAFLGIAREEILGLLSKLPFTFYNQIIITHKNYTHENLKKRFRYIR